MGLACENSRFSSLLAAGDVPRGGTSATQRQKFHTDHVNQRLHNKSGKHGVPNANLFNFTFLLQTSSKKTQMLLLEKNIYSTNIDCSVIDSLRLHLTFCLLPVIRKQ